MVRTARRQHWRGGDASPGSGIRLGAGACFAAGKRLWGDEALYRPPHVETGLYRTGDMAGARGALQTFTAEGTDYRRAGRALPQAGGGGQPSRDTSALGGL